MDSHLADEIIRAMNKPIPEVRCTRCSGIGIHKSGGGTRPCFKCASTGDISKGTGRNHPNWKPRSEI